MQISAQELSKLLAGDKVVPTKRTKSEVEVTAVTPDALPKSVEPDPAEVARFTEAVNELPDVREDLVMELKEKIEKGEYNVSGEEIAEMMIRRMQADKTR